jgi:lysophospholipase L1-like esterase
MRSLKPFRSAMSFLAGFLLSTAALYAASSPTWKFDFGPGQVQFGYTPVLQTTAYNTTTGYGFVSTSGLTSVNRGSLDPLRADYITSSAPFTFSANVPNGNYNITVTTGDNNGTSDTSIKSEVERVVVQQLKTTVGQFSQYSFTVNIKDGVLNLTFYGAAPKINAVEIQNTTTAIIMFIAGDSTVCDQTNIPYAGWGQEFTSYLKSGLAVANYADSGESSTSFWNGFYVPGIQPRIKLGDYLFIQFGHNDEKALTTAQYQAGLKRYIDDARAHGAFPVLVTPLERIVFSGTTLTWSHGAFPDAMKQLATANNVPCIDLTTKSHNLFQSMGKTAASTLFVSGDKTHTNEAGALVVAGLIRDGITELNLSPFKNFILGTTPPPPPPAGSLYEAENFPITGAGTVYESTSAGFSGTGYVNFASTGSTLTFSNVDGNGGGIKSLAIRYALGAAAARTGNLTINGTTTSITFQPTSSGTTWQTMNVNVTLNNNSTNIIQFATTGDDLANIDYINVPPTANPADVYQAESFPIAGTGAVYESTNAGFHGTSYVNLGTTGCTLTFTNIAGQSGGTKSLGIRYALGAATARTVNLVVNGTTTSLTFQPTGSWTTWQTMNVNVTLNNNSTNTIQFATTGNDSGNIDEISVPW